jgi:hypothetical protein
MFLIQYLAPFSKFFVKQVYVNLFYCYSLKISPIKTSIFVVKKYLEANGLSPQINWLKYSHQE